nr:hypothetical protein [Tanacetum cinerariifolium]
MTPTSSTSSQGRHDHHESVKTPPENETCGDEDCLDAPDQAHSGSLTRVVSPRLGYPLVRAPRHRSLTPTHADLLPPCKRLKDSYSPETSMEEDTEIDTTEIEDGRDLDIVDGDYVRDHIKVDLRDDREEFE